MKPLTLVLLALPLFGQTCLGPVPSQPSASCGDTTPACACTPGGPCHWVSVCPGSRLTTFDTTVPQPQVPEQKVFSPPQTDPLDDARKIQEIRNLRLQNRTLEQQLSPAPDSWTAQPAVTFETEWRRITELTADRNYASAIAVTKRALKYYPRDERLQVKLKELKLALARAPHP